MTDSEAFIIDLVRTGFFEIRPDGSIWRLQAFGRTGKRRHVTPRVADEIGFKGYLYVRVQVRGQLICAMSNRIVWMTANGPIPDELEINHIDGDRQSNRLSNLEPLTHGDNQAHSYANLGRHRPVGEDNGNVKLTAEQVAEIRAAKGSVSSRAAGRRYGVSHYAIQRIWNGDGWKEHNEMPERANG